MPVILTWHDAAIRIALALIASFLIGLNRDEHGKAAGIRTTMLVCLAATFAMLQANALMPSVGKAHDSFVVLDLMRLPLGILSGIGFIGAGAILRKGSIVVGVTTAATIWYVTVLGLLFGGGQLALAITASLVGGIVLWLLKYVESRIRCERHATLALELGDGSLNESTLRQHLEGAGYRISAWTVHYVAGATLLSLQCDVHWIADTRHETPLPIQQLAANPAVTRLHWSA